MVRSNDYSHGGNRSSQSGYSDFSEFTTSTSTSPLRKLVSLEIVGSNTSLTPEPCIIDLTQAPSEHGDNADDDYNDDDAVVGADDDLTTCAVHQYVVTVHDDQTGIYAQSESVISQPSHREHSMNDASTAPSSYVPNPYTEYAMSDYGYPVGRYNVPNHYPKQGASSGKGHHTNLRGYSHSTQNGRRKIVQHKSSVLGSLFQCVNPTLPGETDVPMKWVAKTATMKAVSSDEDALDRVFNTVEQYACRNDSDIGREMRNELRQRDNPRSWDARQRHSWKSDYKCVRPDLSDYSCSVPDLSRWKASTSQHKSTQSEDILDAVFGEMETYVCSDAMNERIRHYSTNQKDALDNVFEHFENLTCRDGITAGSLQSRGLRTLHKIPRQHWTPTHTANSKPFAHYPPSADLLERFGRDFERTVCTPQLARCGYAGDLVDHVFDGLEQTTCREQPPKDGGYFDTSVYDLDDQNSLVCSQSESNDWYKKSPNHRLIRKPSWGNTKPNKKFNRKIDLSGYDEHMCAQARYPRSDDSYQSGRARAKHSLERIRAIRERYASHERYYSDDWHC